MADTRCLSLERDGRPTLLIRLLQLQYPGAGAVLTDHTTMPRDFDIATQSNSCN